jgi:chromosomal replication initiator protein
LNGGTEQLPITETNPAWRAVLDELALVLTVENFNTWLASTRVLTREGDLLRVAVPCQFNKDWLETKLHCRVMNTLQRLGYHSMCVEYVVQTVA